MVIKTDINVERKVLDVLSLYLDIQIITINEIANKTIVKKYIKDLRKNI
jgi:hypothetical protein